MTNTISDADVRLEMCLSQPPRPRGEEIPGLRSLGDHRSRMRRVIHRLEHAAAAGERRAEKRHPVGVLVHLTPVSESGVDLPAAVVLPGKSLSLDGLGFFHQQNLPYRKAVASFELGDDQWVGFLVDIAWCRFTRLGWYESGARILGAVESPLQAAAPQQAEAG